MKRLMHGLAALAAVLILAGIAAAQTGQLTGQVLDKEGKPYPEVTVEIKNTATNQTFTTKTDKDGKFTQLGVGPGIYDVTFSNDKDGFNYGTRVQISAAQSEPLNISVKDLIAKNLIANPDAAKKKNEEESKFKEMKEHFQNGLNAMTDAATQKAALKSAPPDQKSGIQDKLTADYTTAISEFQAADQAASPKEAKNHALVLGHLGEAYEATGRFDEAAEAFEKAIALNPQGPFYTHEATNLANSATQQTDPKVRDQKLADAGASCDKATALDPTLTGLCWKNIGIVLSNKGLLAQAVAPLQKASTADPKDPQVWYLLGNALTATISSKQEGDKEIYTIPPGTTEAYQHCIDAAAGQPIADQCKQALDGLQALSGGSDLTVKNRKKK